MKKRVILIMTMILFFLLGVLLVLLKRERDVELVQTDIVEKEQVAETEEERTDIEIEFIDKSPLSDLSELEAGTVVDKERIVAENWGNYFTSNEIGKDILARIKGKSFPENALISLEELRYIKVLHYNYNHEVQVGELIVNQAIAQDCVNIFRELFEIEYEVESMRLIDDYWTGDGVESDTNSIAHNNTSAFNYRVVPGSGHLSNHAKGRAIDLNPLQNPYVKYKSDGSFAHYYKDMELYLDRNSGKAHMITHQDDAFKIFRKYGFFWGGDWNSVKDYQHFEKE